MQKTNKQIDETIDPPYPWAGNRHGTVLSMADLHSQGIYFIKGDVHCKKCDQTYEIEFDLEEKFEGLSEFMTANALGMRQRAHIKWMEPVPLNCRLCNGGKCVTPVIPETNQMINWLFLFLGEMLGFCGVYQLRYFCTHNKRPRSGGKEQVLFRVYLNLFSQVDPTRTFVYV